MRTGEGKRCDTPGIIEVDHHLRLCKDCKHSKQRKDSLFCKLLNKSCVACRFSATGPCMPNGVHWTSE